MKPITLIFKTLVCGTTIASQRLVLLGYNPVYRGTNTRHPTYSADNFLFQVSPDGSLGVATCDDAGQCSSVDIEEIR
ncbi:MAG TPA: hypothetical protein V6D12_21215 [Candidatus Obscuribacterales bacterium]